jgi:hypothetical protein
MKGVKITTGCSGRKREQRTPLPGRKESCLLDVVRLPRPQRTAPSRCQRKELERCSLCNKNEDDRCLPCRFSHHDATGSCKQDMQTRVQHTVTTGLLLFTYTNTYMFTKFGFRIFRVQQICSDSWFATYACR